MLYSFKREMYLQIDPRSPICSCRRDIAGEAAVRSTLSSIRTKVPASNQFLLSRVNSKASQSSVSPGRWSTSLPAQKPYLSFDFSRQLRSTFPVHATTLSRHSYILVVVLVCNYSTLQLVPATRVDFPANSPPPATLSTSSPPPFIRPQHCAPSPSHRVATFSLRL